MKHIILLGFVAIATLNGTAGAQQNGMTELDRFEAQHRQQKANTEEKARLQKEQIEATKGLKPMVDVLKADMLKDYINGEKGQRNMYPQNLMSKSGITWWGDMVCESGRRIGHASEYYGRVLESIRDEVLYKAWDKMFEVEKGYKPQAKAGHGVAYLAKIMRESCRDQRAIDDANAALRSALEFENELIAAKPQREARLAEKAAQAAEKNRQEEREKAERQAEASRIFKEATSVGSEKEAALKSGRAKPTSFLEANALYKPTSADKLIAYPPFKADGQIYYWNGTINKVLSDTEFFVRADPSVSGPNAFVKAVIDRGTNIGVQPRQGLRMIYVGKFVSLVRLRLTGGEEKLAPVFELLYIGN